MMNELTERQEATLIDCLETVDTGGDLEACLSQHPQHAEALRPYLALRARMLTIDQPEPPAPAYQAGRQALLDQVARPSSAGGRWPSIAAFGVRWGRPAEAFVSTCRRAASLAAGGFGRIESPLVRAVAVTALLFVLGGGALGAAAGVGFQPAREVLSTLHMIDDGGGGNAGADSEDGEGAGDDDGGLTTDDGRPAGEDGGVAPPGSDVEQRDADKPEGDDPDDGGSDAGNEGDGRDGEDDIEEPELEAKPEDGEPRLDDTPRRHEEPDDDVLVPKPRPDEPDLAPKPDEPEPTPKPEEPTRTPEPEEPTETPEPDEPAPSLDG